ncbi:MAG TPA: acetyl-CoA decarbonylase/synthase complex subunit delta [Armatimonadetes bacterium]|nr:acetyl-CoA decarbonylase/synthase complex subunit delta [Armatimonadota bacterium]
MPLPDLTEKWSGSIHTVKIGATPEEGGTRAYSIEVGGETGLPFLNFEGETPHRPVVAMEVLDIEPPEWPAALLEPFGEAVKNPVDWARKCVEEFGADLICLKLQGIHPDFGDASPQAAAETAQAVKEAVDVPLIVWGCDDDEKDNAVLPVVSQALAGERALLGTVKEDNYKTLTACCLADGHNLIAESPLDINIAKQVNILVSDMGFPPERIVMYPTTGGLGYGIEYAYSIHERGRLAALSGDVMMAMPIICLIGAEAWRAKEAKAEDEEVPQWGPQGERGPMWETITATLLLQGGADILVMRHPKAVAAVRQYIEALTQ